MAEAKAKTEKKENDIVEIELFKDNGKYKDDMTVLVNGKCWKIQRGVKVKVPRYVAYVIENSLKQDRATAQLIARLEGEYMKLN